MLQCVAWLLSPECTATLGYSNTRKALHDHVEQEDKRDGVTIRDAIGRSQKAVFINESGLYSLILSSKLIEAQVQNDLQNTTCFLRLTSMVRDYSDRNNEVHYTTEMRLQAWEKL